MLCGWSRKVMPPIDKYCPDTVSLFFLTSCLAGPQRTVYIQNKGESQTYIQNWVVLMAIGLHLVSPGTYEMLLGTLQVAEPYSGKPEHDWFSCTANSHLLVFLVLFWSPTKARPSLPAGLQGQLPAAFLGRLCLTAMNTNGHFLAGHMGMRLVPKQNKPFREVYFKPSSCPQNTEILIRLTQELRLSPGQGQLIIANNTEDPSVQKWGTEHATNASWRKALCSSVLLLAALVAPA